MTKELLAQQLRERQIKLGRIPVDVIKSLTDDEIIDSYITCSECGQKVINNAAPYIQNAKNDEDFIHLLNERYWLHLGFCIK